MLKVRRLMSRGSAVLSHDLGSLRIQFWLALRLVLGSPRSAKSAPGLVSQRRTALRQQSRITAHATTSSKKVTRHVCSYENPGFDCHRFY